MLWNQIDEELQSLNMIWHSVNCAEPSTIRQAAASLQFLLSHLGKVLEFTLEQLRFGVVTTPSMRPVCKPPKSSTNAKPGVQSTVMRVGTVMELKRPKPYEEQILTDFERLCSNERRDVFGAHQIIVTINRSIEEDQRYRDCLGTWNTARFSEVASMIELVTFLKAQQPFEIRSRDTGLLGKQQSTASIEYILQLADRIDVICEHNLINPCNGSLDYPFEETRTTAVLDRMRAAEQYLDTFWSTFDATIDLSSDAKIASIVAELQENLAFIAPLSDTLCEEAPIKQPFSTLNFSRLVIDGSDQSSPPHHEKKGPKVKTRGVAAAPEQPESESDEDSVHDEPVKVAVDRRSLECFHILFSVGHAGPLSWQRFRQAMDAAGFQSRNVYGSAWQFRKAGFEGHLLFHDPHGIIERWKMLTMVGDLNKALGWNRDTFVLV